MKRACQEELVLGVHLAHLDHEVNKVNGDNLEKRG